MDQRFIYHNIYRDSRQQFEQLDPQLRKLSSLPLQYQSHYLTDIDPNIPGIYTLTGGRQVGKSTFVKQYVLQLLNNGVSEKYIYFISCELIDNYKDLVRTVETFLNEINSVEKSYIFIDEITYVKNWDLAIKHLADTGQLENTFLLITGSDSTAITDSIKRFPGRRGKARIKDFIYQPLSFKDFVLLRKKISEKDLLQIIQTSTINSTILELLFVEFDDYLISGGYLTAINEYWEKGSIHSSTFATYSEWIRGDILKRNKSELFLEEIINAIIRRIGSHYSWNSLVKDLSIDHPQTVIDYVSLLESMHVLIVLHAINENTFTGAPKKNKKLYFTDPFILHSLVAWLNNSENPFKKTLLPYISDTEKVSSLVESVIINHSFRNAPTFYIKGKGEIDLVEVQNKKILPIEIKWRNQIRSSDLKEIQRFSNGIITTKSTFWGKRGDLNYIPVPVFLLLDNAEF